MDRIQIQRGTEFSKASRCLDLFEMLQETYFKPKKIGNRCEMLLIILEDFIKNNDVKS